MALVVCYECGKQVSNAAVACPSSGHLHMATEAAVVEVVKSEKTEFFKAGGANLVLVEVDALSRLKTVLGLPFNWCTGIRGGCLCWVKHGAACSCCGYGCGAGSI